MKVGLIVGGISAFLVGSVLAASGPATEDAGYILGGIGVISVIAAILMLVGGSGRGTR